MTHGGMTYDEVGALGVGLLSLQLVLGVAAYSIRYRILTRLRAKHREYWQGLGSPTLFSRNSGRMLQLLRKQTYASLQDDVLSRLCRAENAIARVYLIVFGLVVLRLCCASRGHPQ